MKFVLAPDSFKESMTAKEVCIAMENGIRKIYKDAECIYMYLWQMEEKVLFNL